MDLLLMAMLAANYTEKETFISVPGFKGYSGRELAELHALGIEPIMGGDGRDEVAEIRAALGIDGQADIVAAIHAQSSLVTSLRTTIASDPERASMADLLEARNAALEAQRTALRQEAEQNAAMKRINEERRVERVDHKIELMLARGRLTPASKDMARNVALGMAPDQFDEWVKTLPQIDFRERGVATDAQMAELEPTPSEIAIAKQMGNWDDAKPEESRMALMRVRARQRGIILPEEKK